MKNFEIKKAKRCRRQKKWAAFGAAVAERICDRQTARVRTYHLIRWKPYRLWNKLVQVQQGEDKKDTQKRILFCALMPDFSKGELINSHILCNLPSSGYTFNFWKAQTQRCGAETRFQSKIKSISRLHEEIQNQKSETLPAAKEVSRLWRRDPRSQSG